MRGMLNRNHNILLLVTLIIILFLQSISAEDIVYVEYFYSSSCTDCAVVTPIIDEIEQQYEDVIEIERLEVSIQQNWDRWYGYDFVEVPAIVINFELKIPIDEITEEYVKAKIDEYLSDQKPDQKTENNLTTIDTPFGSLNVSELSLPVLTIILVLKGYEKTRT